MRFGIYQRRHEDPMVDLSPQDQQHLQAADGWLGLGNWHEANEELERISPALRSHPDVLFIRWHVYANAKSWTLAAEVANTLSKLFPDNPFGVIHLAYALHEMKRTKEAWDTLLPGSIVSPTTARSNTISLATPAKWGISNQPGIAFRRLSI